MAQIGQFIRTQTGFEGRFRALGIDEEITFVPAEPSHAKNAPAYRILLGDKEGLDIGAGWSHVGDRAGEFVSVEIYSPLFGGTLRANLFRAGDDVSAWGLHTTPPSKKRKKD
ncbi:MAG: DUF736 domain-containing protein [Shinella sp.]|nr:DUF736 domain-containing protein [Shinella sp.]